MTNPLLHSLDVRDDATTDVGRDEIDDWDCRADLARRLIAIGDPGAYALLSALAAERPSDRGVERDLLRAYELTLKGPCIAPDTEQVIRAMTHLSTARQLHSSAAYEEAETHYRSALTLMPESAAAFLNFAQLLLSTRRSEEAVALTQELLRITPTSAAAYQIQGEAFANLGVTEPALAAYRKALEIDPRCAMARLQLGIILRKTGRREEALGHIEDAATQLNAAHAFIELATILREAGYGPRADAALARAHTLQPLTVRPASGSAPEFIALMLWAPGCANTPVDYLIERAGYECRMLSVVADCPIDYRRARESAEVVVNLIADADQGGGLLPGVIEAMAQETRPIINHPRSILRTDRAAISQRLSGLAGCHVPRTERCRRGQLLAASSDKTLVGVPFPVLLRHAGTHGGDAFECVTGLPEVATFFDRFPTDAYYVTAFVDYRSPDGYFRKYRLIVVDGEIFPYHLAISDHWKVHHYRTDMTDHLWMQKEEEAFLTNPQKVFTAEHFGAVGTIRDIVDLEFFGIDCALDRNGRLLIFEVNACMLVEPDDSRYAFKLPHNAAVKAAFARLLARSAATSRVQATE